MVNSPNPEKGKEFTSFATKRMILASALAVVLVWGLSAGLNLLESPETSQGPVQVSAKDSHAPVATPQQHSAPSTDTAGHAVGSPPAAAEKTSPSQAPASQKEHATTTGSDQMPLPTAGSHVQETTVQHEKPAGDLQSSPTANTHAVAPTTAGHEKPSLPTLAAPEPLPVGVTFVEAAIKPLEYELKERFWGWRPNDIINFTDNVNSYQLGVLEVTRRTVVQLAERISRTGSTAAFNRNLENAMNWLMIKPESYWFPAPETKYIESLEELEAYRQKLVQKSAPFYTRTDNLIPLLAAFEDLLGSCDENLVKATEADGTQVSYFHTDDYFYYTRGVASAMATILEAVEHDFSPMLQGRLSAELLHHAIESCKRGAQVDPWLVTDGDLGGILANHRAHMAAPISHARFYLGQLIKTLST